MRVNHEPVPGQHAAERDDPFRAAERLTASDGDPPPLSIGGRVTLGTPAKIGQAEAATPYQQPKRMLGKGLGLKTT